MLDERLHQLESEGERSLYESAKIGTVHDGLSTCQSCIWQVVGVYKCERNAQDGLQKDDAKNVT